MFYIKLDDEPYHYSNYYDNKTKVSCLPPRTLTEDGKCEYINREQFQGIYRIYLEAEEIMYSFTIAIGSTPPVDHLQPIKARRIPQAASCRT